MISRLSKPKTFDIITFRSSATQRKQHGCIVAAGVVILPFIFLFVWPPMILILLIVVPTFAYFNGKRLSKFDVIGSITCYADYLEILKGKTVTKISIRDIAGIILKIELANGTLFSRGAEKSKSLAYYLNIKGWTIKNTKIVVYNFEDSSKRFHSSAEESFMDIIFSYAEQYDIKFWDGKGGESQVTELNQFS